MRWPDKLRVVVLIAALIALNLAPAFAADTAKDKTDQAAAQAVSTYLEQALKNKKVFPFVQRQLKRVAELNEPVLAKALPEFRFLMLRFRMYPVAYSLPAPLRAANLFAVDVKAENKVTHMTTPKQLQAFCGRHLRATDADAARTAAHVYAVLRKHLARDGFFRFTIDPAKFHVDGKPGALSVKARIVVVPGGGNSGSIDIAIAFQGKEGIFSVTDEQIKLRAGMRPICQSLKLNDPDRTVRAKAEHDLLIMGVNALPYLRMQSGKTEGELRQAILKLIRRIEAGERLPGGQPPAN